MRLGFLLLTLAPLLAPPLSLAGCNSAGTDEPPMDPPHVAAPGPWTDAFEPPRTLDTARVHLEPLAPSHVELDFAALMGSREHLQRTLHWGDWPRPDFTLAENRDDLARHWQEFVDREAYAYTVLSPDGSRCVGCVYLEALPGGGPDDAAMAYWVIEPELATDLDRHLLEALGRWFEDAWPWKRVVLQNHRENARGHDVASALGWSADDGALALPAQDRPAQTLFVWERAGSP
jgi:RimJ/RimL family protein N-acetyltransferase